MRTIEINTFASLDGVMQAPGGPEEDPSGGFQFGGWSVSFWDDEMGRVMDATVREPFDLLLGRRTYEIFAAHWPHVTDDPMADALNRATKYVASTTVKDLPWKESVLIDGDAAEGIARLKDGSGPPLQVHGSANLIQTLLRHGLVDEFRVWTFPVLLGEGKRLFGEGTVPGALSVVDTKTFSKGVVLTTYRPAGQIEIGSFAFEEPTAEEQERRRKLAEE